MKFTLTPPGDAVPAHPRQQQGIALVITLSFLLVTTVIIVAFLVRARFDYQASANYSASVQSDLLAAGALDRVVADFMEEIVQGSEPSPPLPGGLKWFEPRNVGNTFPSMIPYAARRAEIVAPETNLLKQSAATSFYDGGPVRDQISSVESSDDTKPNSRPVTAERWNLPRLLLTADGSEAADFPDDGVPYWVYLDENGEETTAAGGGTTIIGRFAYNAYDVGGLLNANIAGFFSPGIEDRNIGTKGTTVLADLTAIPGLNGQDVVNELVSWRTAPTVSWGAAWDYTPVPGSGSSLSPLDFIRLGAASGWTRNPLNEAAQGNQFFSRRDLQKYLTDRGLEQALPFLTHFSVDADAPSFSPPTDILTLQGGLGYDLRESDANGGALSPGDVERINPPRSAPDTFLTALPLPDNTVVPAPVLSNRFPLSRLALVATDLSARSEAGSTPGWVEQYFGLREVDDYTWEYIDSEIKTLDEVAADNRRPNFFELLKSVISVGSLGQYKQTIDGALLQTREPRANVIDEHILRIGAAIIDQADGDSYPTRIQFNYDATRELGEIYGVEDLPYINSVRFVAYSKPGGTNLNNQSGSAPKVILAQPSLWNPHDPERSSHQSATTPDSFQIQAFNVLEDGGPIVVNGNNWSIPTGFLFGPSDVITIDGWDPLTEVFRQPQGLLSVNYPAGVTLSGPSFSVDPSLENPPFASLLSPFSSGQAIGFRIAEDPDPPPLPTGRVNNWLLYDGGGLQLLLQYEADGDFFTYDRFWWSPKAFRNTHPDPRYSSITFNSIFSGRNDPGTTTNYLLRSDAVALKSDPRSQRFIWSSDIARFTGANPGLRHAMPEYTTMGFYGGVASILEVDPGRNLIAAWNTAGNTYRKDAGLVSLNRRDLPFFYTDPDGVTRRAMGGAANSSGLPTAAPNSGGAIINNPARLGFPMQTRLALGATSNAAYYPNRPIVLNRPFRSVGELANAFRDIPWKNIDFSFPESGDTGLLDVFTVYENDGQSDAATPLVAGKVNINTAPKPVLAALVKGTSRKLATLLDPESEEIESLTEAETIAERIVQYRSDGSPSESDDGVNGPLRSLAEIVGRTYSATGGNSSSNASFVGLHPESLAGANSPDGVLQERLSALTRSLADSSTTRSWNVMIDLVAQSGRIPAEGTLEDFSATSESRWWMFVSIDRFTGRVLSRSVERIVE